MKRFLRSFDSHSDKTVTLGELLWNVNNFSNKIVDVIRKSHEFIFKIVGVITVVISNRVNFLVNDLLWRQSLGGGCSMTSRFAAILLLSPPSYIQYTLGQVNTDDSEYGTWPGDKYLLINRAKDMNLQGHKIAIKKITWTNKHYRYTSVYDYVNSALTQNSLYK